MVEMSRQERAAVATIDAVAEAIREMGSQGMISGHLYAHVCGTISLSEYSLIIALLKARGLVSERQHVLTWIGPAQWVADRSILYPPR